MSPRNYVLLVLSLTSALAAGTMIFNQRTDPYALRGAQSTPGSVDARARPGELHRKLEQTANAHARTAILGTSRVESSLRTNHPAFAADDHPVINLGLGGVAIEQIHLLLRDAHAKSPLHRAIVGLDLEAFTSAGRSDIDPSMLAGNFASAWPALSWLRMRISADTTLASLRQHLGIFRKGPMEPGGADDTREERDKQLDGQRGIVWMTEFRNFYSRLPQLFPDPSNDADWSRDPQRRMAMASFAEMIRFARREKIELHLFISPVHARWLDWYRRVGWWPRFEAWKRALVAQIEEAGGAQHERGPSIILWDLSGFRGPASESVPRLKDMTTRMHWYRESSHYSEQFGDRILDIVLGNSAPDESWPVRKVDGSNIEAHLLQLREDADAYREAVPGEALNVASMVSYLRKLSRR